MSATYLKQKFSRRMCQAEVSIPIKRLRIANYNISIHKLSTLYDCSIRVIALMHGDCFIREFQSFWWNSVEESTNKHHAIEYNVHDDIITFIRHFLLVFSPFCFHPIPVFLEFYLPQKFIHNKAVNTKTRCTSCSMILFKYNCKQLFIRQ